MTTKKIINEIIEKYIETFQLYLYCHFVISGENGRTITSLYIEFKLPILYFLHYTPHHVIRKKLLGGFSESLESMLLMYFSPL